MLAIVVAKKGTTPIRSSVILAIRAVIIGKSVAPAVIQTIYSEIVLWEKLHVSFVRGNIMCLLSAA
jgi:hypothetical protein